MYLLRRYTHHRTIRLHIPEDNIDTCRSNFRRGFRSVSQLLDIHQAEIQLIHHIQSYSNYNIS
jgi:hypothetical protein